MSIHVLNAGLSSIQDLGRFGCEAMGVAPGGASDPDAAQLANALVHNCASAAIIELIQSTAQLAFESDTVVALTGARVEATLNQLPFPLGRPVWIQAGSVLRVTRFDTGRVLCIGVNGGIDVPQILGSRSTDLAAGFGGFEGRWLRQRDVLPTLPCSIAPRPSPRWWVELPLPARSASLRFVPGPLAAAGLAAQQWRVGSASSRMGVVLEGEVINAALPEQVSAGVLPGVIQLPPSGLPLILSTDAQTIGGYPIVGAVIAADLRWLAQLQPGSTVRLQPVNLAQARTLAIKARAQFNAALYAIADKQKPHALD
jgi:biotin-dependent carboxylase-like uncharacterized protein